MGNKYTSAEDKIAVMRAFVDGKAVQYSIRWGSNSGVWRDASTPTWEWGDKDFRIKPVALVRYAIIVNGKFCTTCDTPESASYNCDNVYGSQDTSIVKLVEEQE